MCHRLYQKYLHRALEVTNGQRLLFLFNSGEETTSVFFMSLFTHTSLRLHG